MIDVLGRLYSQENCSAARALEVVGERWSLLIIRNALFAGCTRFNDFERALGIAPNILSTRLSLFLEAGLMRTQETANGKEYRLTDKGAALAPVIVALTAWGDRWDAPQGPPVLYEHVDCGGTVEQHLVCSQCEAELRPDDIAARPGPGSAGHG